MFCQCCCSGIIKSLWSGQASVTLEWKDTPGKKQYHIPDIMEEVEFDPITTPVDALYEARSNPIRGASDGECWRGEGEKTAVDTHFRTARLFELS